MNTCIYIEFRDTYDRIYTNKMIVDFYSSTMILRWKMMSPKMKRIIGRTVIRLCGQDRANTKWSIRFLEMSLVQYQNGWRVVFWEMVLGVWKSETILSIICSTVRHFCTGNYERILRNLRCREIVRKVKVKFHTLSYHETIILVSRSNDIKIINTHTYTYITNYKWICKSG